MAALQGTVRVRRRDQVLTFQVEDCGMMIHGLPVRRRVEQELAAGATAVRVDLSHCTYMDSTFIGTLLCLQRSVTDRGRGTLTLIAPSPQCSRLLNEMGVQQVFRIETAAADEPGAGSWTELSGPQADVHSFKRNVVQAHQELGKLDGPAGEPFRWLGRRLADELEAEERK
jgi:anti-anti-sigma factor